MSVETRIEIIDDFSRPLKDLKDSLVDAYEAQSVFINAVKETNKEITGTVKTMSSFIDAIKDDMLTMDYIVDKQDELVNSTKQMQYMFSVFGKETSKAWKLGKEGVSKSWDVTKAAFSDLWYDLKVGGKLIWRFTKDSAYQFKAFAVESITPIRKFGKDMVSSISSSSKQMASAFKTSFSTIRGEIKLANTMSSNALMGTGFFSRLNPFLFDKRASKLRGAVWEDIKSSGGGLKKTFLEVFGTLKKSGIETFGALKESLAGGGFIKVPFAAMKKGIGESFGKLSGELAKSRANIAKYGKESLKALETIPKSVKKMTEGAKLGLARDVGMAATRFVHFGFVSALNKSTDAMIKKTVDAYVRGIKTIMSIAEQHFAKFDVFDRNKGYFGADKAKFMSASTYEWAQEHGQDWTMVHRLGTDATYKGIGSKDFRRIMTLADKIETLSPNTSIEDAANRIIDSIKNGHDAGSVTQMFGGGQKMERQMRRMGYERALRRGDVTKALDIAEKVAEQAGLTEERYTNAQKTLSRSYATINNTIENVKQKIGMVLAQHIEPIINKISDFVTSPEFKKGISFIAFIVDKIGAALEKAVNFFIDNIKIIGIMIGLFILTKLWLVINTVLGLGSILGFVKTLIFDAGKAVAFLHGKFAGLIAFLRKSSFIDKFLITPMIDFNKKTRTAIRQHGILGGVIRGTGFALKSMFLNPITISAVMAGVLLYYMEDIVNAVGKLVTGSDKTVKLWASIPGMINMAREFATNFFENVFIFFDNTFSEISLLGGLILRLPILSIQLWGKFFEFFGEGLSEMMKGLSEIGKKIADAMPKYSVAWGIGEGLSKMGDLGSMSGDGLKMLGGTLEGWATGKLDDFVKEAKEYSPKKYVDMMKGVDQASQIETWGELFKDAGGDKILGFLDDISKKLGLSVDTENEIQGRTDLIAETMQQEEELRWLKAFSDRQIGSAYNSMTSYNTTTTINGASQQTLIEMGRRAPSSVPKRTKKAG